MTKISMEHRRGLKVLACVQGIRIKTLLHSDPSGRKKPRCLTHTEELS